MKIRLKVCSFKKVGDNFVIIDTILKASVRRTSDGTARKTFPCYVHDVEASGLTSAILKDLMAFFWKQARKKTKKSFPNEISLQWIVRE